MGSVWDLSNKHNRERFDMHIGQLLLNGKHPKVEVLPEKRSLDQNALIHALYKEIAGQKEDESIVSIMRECKAYCGVPILLASNEKFAKLYKKGIMPHLTPEEKLEAMDVLPVTRLMNTEQCTQYIDEVIRRYSAQGISIVMPGEL